MLTLAFYLFGFLAVAIVAVMDDPTAFFLVSTLILCIGCLSILLPVFVPKWLQRHTEAPKGRKANSLFTRRSKSFKWNVPPRDLSSESSARSSGIISTLQMDFLETKPQKIKRVSSSASQKRVSSSSLSNHRHSSERSYVYKTLAKGPAMVSKAILLRSSQETSTVETVPAPLDAVMEASGNEAEREGEEVDGGN